MGRKLTSLQELSKIWSCVTDENVSQNGLSLSLNPRPSESEVNVIPNEDYIFTLVLETDTLNKLI